jgi:hypothetical protein
VGVNATVGLLVYLLAGGFIIRNTLPNFKKIVAKEAKLDGRF